MEVYGEPWPEGNKYIVNNDFSCKMRHACMYDFYGRVDDDLEYHIFTKK